MSAEADKARMVAERIARRVSGGSALPARQTNDVGGDITNELAAMHASLDELQNRLIQIESKVRSGSPTATYATATQTPSTLRTHSPWLAGLNATTAHPSQERFGVEEATVSELVDFFQNEKICSVEPGGKPCDHCAMCSSRGF
jgi:hypothetical protein